MLRPRRGWAFEFRAILLAMTLAVGGLASVPGSWFLHLEPIEILQNAGEEPFVVHRARLWLPIERDITYSAEVLEVVSALDGSPRDTVVCRGVSTWHLPPRELQEVRITLKAWIDDHDCTLRRGRTYYARVVYHFELFGFSKVAEIRTTAVAMPIVRMLVGPTVPPGL
jgi:hypothetical protein